MLAEYIETGIKSYKSRIDYESRRAQAALIEGDYMTAANAATWAHGYQQAIEELETLKEEAETWR